MTSLITTTFKTLLARKFFDLLDINSNSYLPIDKRTYTFVGIGKQTPWNSGTEIAPSPDQATRSLSQIYRDTIVLKRLSQENASFVVQRVNWEYGTLYAAYGCGVCPAGTNFYVLNSKDQVFKCLYNNGQSLSTSEPQLSLSSTSLEEPYFETADGYKWKYMYTLTSLQKQRFLSSDWMPVTYNKFVRAAAVNRSLDIVRITNSGNNYVDGGSQDIITITGDGTDAILKANVVGGQIVDIIIQNRGQDYTTANLTISDVAGGIGSNAAAVVVFSPQNGHGYDPVEELYTSTVMFNVDYDGSENDVFPAENEYRQVYMIQNPLENGSTNLANSEIYTAYTKVKVSPGVGDFSNDEKVFQGIDLARSTFNADVISFDENTNYLYLNNIFGTLNTNEPIKGNESGSIRVAINKTDPTIKLYSGNLLYISNSLPVSRDPDQTDRIRFVLSF
ncbi:MAG: hypothetical protein ACO239_00470 [Sediminibacterium sp.]